MTKPVTLASMSTIWKFRLTRNPRPHLSREAHGHSGTGDLTLCGSKITRILGSARTVKHLEGDECLRCSEAYTTAGSTDK
jgi:hypothetical protein